MIGPCSPEVVSTPHPPTTFVLALTPVVPAASAGSATPERRCSRSVSEKERFGHSDCCPCLRDLGDHCLGCSFHGRLRATCPFLLVTPNTTPDHDIYFSRASVMMSVTEIGKWGHRENQAMGKRLGHLQNLIHVSIALKLFSHFICKWKVSSGK